MKSLMNMICLFLFAALALASSVSAAELADREITFAVERELANDPALPSQFIDVETRRGVVVLSGGVDNLLAKDRATEVAETVKGVRSVVNNITIQPVQRDDQELLSDIEVALIKDPATEEIKVNTEVRNGTVTLSGHADSWAEKQLVSNVVRGVRGVQALNNNMKLSVKDIRLDSEIKDEIVRRLKWDVWVDDSLILVSVNQGDVALSGKAGSAMEKSRAFRLAWIAGVKSVDHSGLMVDWTLHEKSERSEPPQPSAAEIEKAVKDAFTYDPRLSTTDIEVDATDGVVVISGIVDNLKARNAAAQDARNTLGVWRVRNHIKVRPAMGSYQLPSYRAYPYAQGRQIADAARASLLRDPIVSQHEIGVQTGAVFRGIVYLEGRVDSEYEKHRAEDIISGIDGIVQVYNNIEVGRSWEKRPDWEIKEEVEDELWWSPFVDSNRVSVSVENGIVTLTGVVNNLRERRAATANAYDGGARHVRNFLKVQNGPEVLAAN